MGKKQQDLFDVEVPAWELDDWDAALISQVSFVDPPHGPFDYLVPPNFAEKLHPGMRVSVPLGRGNRSTEGYCTKVTQALELPVESRPDPRRLKSIERVVDAQSLVSPRLLELAHWISDYYICPLAIVLETLVPTGVRRQSGTREVKFFALAPQVAKNWSGEKLSEKQRRVMEALAAVSEPLTLNLLCDQAGCTAAPVANLIKRGLVIVRRQRVRKTSHPIVAEPPEGNFQLSDEQATALAEIESQLQRAAHATFLMHGITGSGKTEVYIRAIQKVIEFGRQAIVLVPEISLTPQTRQRFRARFENVAVLHSHLSDAERAWHWQEIQRGRIQVVIGARSAVFAPLPNLGMIVIDEEHDASFKQDKAPRYHGRDVALWRAQREHCPLILGSATPSLESWYQAQRGEYKLLNLGKRVFQRPLPDVQILDLRAEFTHRKSRGAISRQLHVAIRQALDGHGQVILLLNRRGFATSIQCPACGEAVYCPDCAIPLTHHKDGHKAVCHYCDHQIPEPQRCPKCGFSGIRFLGFGTQKLEQEVRVRFPDAVCARMDTDTMSKPGSHERILNRFRAGEISILVGTQMIAKGLDFPNVTLVGVVNADTALHLPDFRAAERTFSLVTQVAGRSGRGPKGGRVLVQTFSPEHPAISAAAHHDYARFAALELRHREEFQYPPIARMARIVARGSAEQATKLVSQRLAERIEEAARTMGIELTILGPAPAPVEKLRGKYRFHFLIQSKVNVALPDVIRAATADFDARDEVQWIVDMDPLDML
jgi:primosomal protein N' (replication factor Y)